MEVKPGASDLFFGEKSKLNQFNINGISLNSEIIIFNI